MSTQFHLVSFEGPDAYSRAGGIASRVCGLSRALVEAGFETHLWFVGDPDLPGHEMGDGLCLHRWCQWISRYHGEGVYAGEEGKRLDLARSLPPFLAQEALLPHLADPEARAVVMAEEWQTVDAVLHLDWLLRCLGLRDRVVIRWNANNTFGFERIDWARLAAAAVITTVSRYMQQRMAELGVEARVIPNGLPADAYRPSDRRAVQALRRCLLGRTVLAKVARWDRDKRWLLAVDIVGALKRLGDRPLLIARGGMEAHGAEVLGRAAAGGLRVVDRELSGAGPQALLRGLRGVHEADVVNIRSPLVPEVSRVLFRAAAAVLANGAHEPFGLVGLETMAAGGLACTGGTGEDYAVPGWNALVLPSDDPEEFVGLFGRVKMEPVLERAMRRRAKSTARRYAWSEVVRRNLVPDLAGRGRPGWCRLCAAG